MSNKISKNRRKYLLGLALVLILFLLAIPLAKPAQAVELANPLCEKPGQEPCIQDIASLVIRMISFILSALGIFGVFMIIYGGFLFLIAGGNEETIKKAKATLVWAVIGLAIILCSRIIVGFVATTLNPAITTQSTNESGAADKESSAKNACALGGGICTVTTGWSVQQLTDRACVSDPSCTGGGETCCHN